MLGRPRRGRAFCPAPGRPKGRHVPGIAAGTTTAQRLQLLEQAHQRQPFACSHSGVLRQQTFSSSALEWPNPLHGDRCSRVCGFRGMIAVNADTNLVLQGEHLDRLSGNLSMDFARFHALFLAAIATLAGASAEAGQAPSGLGDLVPGLLPAVVNIYSMKIVSQSDSQTSRVTSQHRARRKVSAPASSSISAGVIVTNEHVIEHAYDISVDIAGQYDTEGTDHRCQRGGRCCAAAGERCRPLPIVRLGDSKSCASVILSSPSAIR